MPRYDYGCDLCAVIYETTDNPESIRCSCGGTMTRIWTAPGVIFRGTGWGKDANK